MKRSAEVKRKTRETDIELSLDLDASTPISIGTGVPFLDHILHSMAFHGGFSLSLTAQGDLNVDAHHTVEDIGVVLGEAFSTVLEKSGAVTRFGHAVIPMDDALAEATVDVCERAYMVYRADYPQFYSGSFQMALLREFFHALSSRARINLHLDCRYGENSHHMAEALFKALGKALAQAYGRAGVDQAVMSTKGTL